MSIPNADLIQAVLDGKTVQVTPNDDGWTDMEPGAAIVTLVRAASGLKFRIKPRAIVNWLPVYRHETEGAALGNVYVDRDRVPQQLPGGPVLKIIRLELDPHTLEPVSVRAEAPGGGAAGPDLRPGPAGPAARPLDPASILKPGAFADPPEGFDDPGAAGDRLPPQAAAAAVGRGGARPGERLQEPTLQEPVLQEPTLDPAPRAGRPWARTLGRGRAGEPHDGPPSGRG